MYNAEKIEEILTGAFQGGDVQVIDLTGTGNHFQALVIWKGFEGMPRIQQHQAVMAPLQEGLKEAIHALQIKTFTPESWKKKETAGTQLPSA